LTVSAEAFKRSLDERVSLNRQILENPYWFLPVDDKGHENYVPVGRGVKSSDFCGVHRGYDVCKDVEAHKGKVVDGVDYTDAIAVRHKHWWCKKAGCPVCFIRGWSVREARFIEARLLLAVERGFGEVEHVVVSAPEKDYGLSEKVLRERARAVLSACGVVGYCMIFHGYRIARGRRVLAWGSHYHVLAFLDGGYDKCRQCKGGDCRACGGVEGRCYKAFDDTGWIVRVLEKRETVYGSAWYQLHHSTIRLGIKRFHVVTWGGRVAYNNFRSEGLNLKAESPCFVCGGEMTKHFYVGKCYFAKNVGDVNYKPRFAVHVSESDDFVEVIGEVRGRYSGSYEGGNGSYE